MSDPAPSPAPRLELHQVSASYGGPDVIRGASLEIYPGEVVALLGPNGAGKTTLLNAISGTVVVSLGRIALNGRPIHRLPPHRIVGLGVAHVPQGRQLFGYSTGYENLRAGGYTRTDRRVLEADIKKFGETWPVAARVFGRIGHLMSGGEQQVIAIGRGLMSHPLLLLLDEPSLGLAPILVDQLFAMIRTLVSELREERGLSVLLVEQNVRKALAIADRAYVLVSGRIVKSDSASSLTPEQVVGLYMGTSSDGTDGGK